jgi:serine/threonine-protein kinase
MSAPRQLGPYEVVEELARGGMGVVYRARQQSPQREVALKLLLGADADPQARGRFQRETDALAKLQHPNLVRVHAAGQDGSRPYLVMELLDGPTLQARLDDGGPLDSRAAAELARALASGLVHAHAAGVLHRDLKPANVLLTERGPVLTDFGLARAVDPRVSQALSKSGAFLGSPGYWAPEQAQGKVHDHGPAVDVYGLGGVLYASLTGQPPCPGGSLIEALAAVQRPPRPPRSLRPSVDPALEAICLRCLAKAPADRYASIEAAQADLEAFLRGDLGAPRGRLLRLALAALGLVVGGALALTFAAGPAPEEAPPVASGPPAPSPPDASTTEPPPPDPSTRSSPGPPPLPGETPGTSPPEERPLEPEQPAQELPPPTAAEQAIAPHLEAGRKATSLGDWRTARGAYRKALDLEPDDAEALLGCSRAALWLTDMAVGGLLAERVLAQTPGHPEATLLYVWARWVPGTTPDQTRELIRELAALHAVAPSADNLALQGYLHLSVGEPEIALLLCEGALELDPRCIRARYARAWVFQSQNRPEDVIAECDLLLDQLPRWTDVLLLRANNKRRVGRTADALADFEQAKETDPTHSPVYGNLAALHMDQRDYGAAVECFDQEIALSPYPKATSRRGRGRAHYLLEDMAAARADLQVALDLHLGWSEGDRHRRLRPTEFDVYLLLADAQARLNDFQAAAVTLEAARKEIGPAHPLHDALGQFERQLAPFLGR